MVVRSHNLGARCVHCYLVVGCSQALSVIELGMGRKRERERERVRECVCKTTHTVVPLSARGVCSKTPSGWMPETMDSTESYMYCFYLYTPFHLKEALCAFSLAYSNCQHHQAGTLGPQLSKIRAV